MAGGKSRLVGTPPPESEPTPADPVRVAFNSIDTVRRNQSHIRRETEVRKRFWSNLWSDDVSAILGFRKQDGQLEFETCEIVS